MYIEEILCVQSAVSLNEMCKNYGIPHVNNEIDYDSARTKLLNVFKETAEFVVNANVLETTLGYAKEFARIDKEYNTEYNKISKRMNDLACELNNVIREINGGNDWKITE